MSEREISFEITEDLAPNTFRICVYSPAHVLIAKCIGYRNRLDHTVKLYPKRVYVPGVIQSFPVRVGEEHLRWARR